MVSFVHLQPLFRSRYLTIGRKRRKQKNDHWKPTLSEVHISMGSLWCTIKWMGISLTPTPSRASNNINSTERMLCVVTVHTRFVFPLYESSRAQGNAYIRSCSSLMYGSKTLRDKAIAVFQTEKLSYRIISSCIKRTNKTRLKTSFDLLDKTYFVFGIVILWTKLQIAVRLIIYSFCIDLYNA